MRAWNWAFIPDTTHLMIRVGSGMRWNAFAKPSTIEMSGAVSTSYAGTRGLGRTGKRVAWHTTALWVFPITSVSALAPVCLLSMVTGTESRDRVIGNPIGCHGGHLALLHA